ncbi:unnamed protein product [Linum trigynum]|uniref:Uncharacterized protein n=1 Tax=Linum trigynum TaxID=586398 RepID=A0AAV2GQH3_9ROSI
MLSKRLKANRRDLKQLGLRSDKDHLLDASVKNEEELEEEEEEEFFTGAKQADTEDQLNEELIWGNIISPYRQREVNL